MTLAVVILAAGRGSRLAGDTPKWFLRVGGLTIADRQLEGLRRAEGLWERLLVVTGFRQELFGAEALGCELVPNPEWSARNNWWSLALALERLEGRPGGVCVLNSDLLIGPATLARFLEAAASSERSLLAVDEGGPHADEQMNVALADGLVVDIGKGTLSGPPAGEYVGLAALAPGDVPVVAAVLRSFAANPARVDEWYEAAFREAMQAGTAFGVFPVEPGRWIEIDDETDLARAEAVAARLEED